MNENELTPKQHALIAALVGSSTVIEACRAAHVAERTGRRWLTMPAFQRVLRTAQAAIFQESIVKLLRLVDPAIDALERNMRADADIPPGVQVRAALGSLEQATAHARLVELDAKIAALEQVIAERLPAKREDNPLWKLNH